MNEEQPSTLASDAEIEAALAEAESETIPSLDDGGGVVPVPVSFDDEAPHSTRPQEEFSGEVVATVGSGDSDAGAESDTAQSPRRSWTHYVYVAIDMTLTAINAPFRWMPEYARQVTGLIAIVTIITTILAIALIPRLCPNRHPITDLQRMSAAVLAEPEPAPVGESGEN